MKALPDAWGLCSKAGKGNMGLGQSLIGVLLALLVIGILCTWLALVSQDRLPLTRRYRKRVAFQVPAPLPGPSRPDLGLRLAGWLGKVCGRLWREFHYWTVGDDD
jgi:hypothetical protein